MTLYFQFQFIKLSCPLDVGNGIRNSIKNRKNNSAMKKKCYDNPELRKQYEKRKYKKNSELKKKYQRKKEAFDKVENFNPRIRQWPYYICTAFHRCLYQVSVRIFQENSLF